MHIELRDLGPLPGLEDFVDPAASEGDIAAALAAADLPLQATMSMRDTVGSLVAWVRGRRLVKALSEAIVPITWFECHVPHGGTAQERFAQSQKAEAGVAIKAFGSGLGRGRGFALDVSSEAAAPRTQCVHHVVDVRVLPRVYEAGGRESFVVEVLEPTAQRSIDIVECPQCALPPDAIDPFDNETRVPLDLRSDSVGRKEIIKLEWSTERSFDVGVEIPHAGAGIALNARVVGSGSIAVAYELRPGVLYQAYWPIDGHGGPAPRWAHAE